MLTAPSTSVLAQTALSFLHARFKSLLTKPLDETHVIFSVDGANSQFVITPRAQSTGGDFGRYINEARWPYVKARLDLVVPYPLAVWLAFPSSFLLLRTYMREQYNVILEEGEFALASAPSVPLVDTSEITGLPDADEGWLELVTLPQSGRWVTGSTLALAFDPINGPHRLSAFVDLSQERDLSILAYPP